jgi:hypothetical protein
MVVYNEDVIINAPYKLTLKNTDSYWVDLRCLQNPNGIGWPGILEVNNHIKCLRDISTYGGAFMTASAPGTSGGGAIQMGHGFERTDDPPRINLTDANYHTLYVTAGSSVGVGADAVLADVKVKNLYWSSGAYLTDNQGGSIELGNSSAAVSYPFIDFHFGRSTTEDFNVRLINYQDCILEFHTRTSTGGILPGSSGNYVLGSPDKHWSYVYADYLRYDINIAQFDAYDDLALVKLWGEKDTVIPDTYDPTKLKPPASDPFSILKGKDTDGKVEEEFFDVGKTVSFAMGCAKALAKKQDEHDALLLNLLSQVESLRSEIVAMKKA